MYPVSSEKIKAEFFGYIKPHQLSAVNYHLAHCLKLFDEQYRRFAKIGSLGHHADRIEFARNVTECLINDLQDKDYTVTKINTETHFVCKHADCEIVVESESKIGDDINKFNPLAWFPGTTPN